MLAGLVGLFALGTVGFWVLVCVVCGVLIAAVEFEKPGWATVSLVATFAALGWLGDFNVLAATKAHPLIALGCVGGYIALGTVYSFVKWWRFLRGMRAKYLDSKAAFLEAHGVQGTAIPDRLVSEWNGDKNYYSRQLSQVPKARDHKARIMTWMVYWPWSMIWTVINDPIKKAFRAIYRELQAQYQKIADKVFADVQDDFRAPPPTPPPAADDQEKIDGLQSRSRGGGGRGGGGTHHQG